MSDFCDNGTIAQQRMLDEGIEKNKRQLEAGHTVYVLFLKDGEKQYRIMRNVTKDERIAALAAHGIVDSSFGVATENHHSYSITGNCQDLMDEVREDARHSRRHALYSEELPVPMPQAAVS